MRPKYMLVVIVILYLVNLLNCNIYASDSPTVSNDTQNEEASKQIIDEEHQSITNLSEQIALLETQNQLLKEHNRDLLNTVHWAIGFAALFLIAAFGLIGYFTYLRYEQDKKTLSNSIKSEITVAITGLEHRYSDFEKKSTDYLQMKTRSLEQSLRSIVKSASSQAIRYIDKHTEDLKRNILILQIDILTLEAEQRMNKGQLTNAIECWFHIAEKAWLLKWDWQISEALKNIKSLLEKGAKFKLAATATRLTAFIQSLPPEYEQLVNAIQSKIQVLEKIH